jgi:hypothetical protein
VHNRLSLIGFEISSPGLFYGKQGCGKEIKHWETRLRNLAHWSGHGGQKSWCTQEGFLSFTYSLLGGPGDELTYRLYNKGRIVHPVPAIVDQDR